MKDGFYLSTYLEISEIANLFENSQRHDSNIALWHKQEDKIKLVHYWELERETGIKQNRIAFFDVKQSRDVINKLLKTHDLCLDDIVEVWGTPGLDTCKDYHSVNDYPELSYHSVAHLFSSIMLDTDKFYNENIIGLAVDGAPDTIIDKDSYKKAFYSGCVVKNGEVKLFPISSPGPLWMIASNQYKLKEGTLMALASASKSNAFITDIEIPLMRDCLEFPRMFEYFNKLNDRIQSFTEEDQGILFDSFDPSFTVEENKISMVMKIIQDVSYKIMEKNVDDIIAKHGIKPEETYLALSGGYALNCPSNSYLMNKYKFKGFIAPPCVSDTGVSLGIGLYAFYKKMKNFKFNLSHAYYGDCDNDLGVILQNQEYMKFIKNVSEFDSKIAVEDLENSPIVWFDGAAEIGPRALGNRSILADPRKELCKDQLNVVKQRQWWRPVAPIVLEKDIEEWFISPYESPFMLHTFTIKKEKMNLVPAIAHLDGTARVQTINNSLEQKNLYKLINEFKEKSGIPIICNTSLNDRGEPIINRIEEAINFVLRKGIKVAYINGKRIEFQNHNEYLVDKPLKRHLQIVEENDEIREQLLKKYNPFNISKETLEYYYNIPELYMNFDLKCEKDIRKLDIATKIIKSKYGSN